MKLPFHIIHPEGKCCPECGCDSIPWWPEIDNWDKLTDKEKEEFEKCPDCDYYK